MGRRFNLEDIDSIQKLPEAEPMLPGHTLLRPSKDSLKSAVKYPIDDKNAVYGNYGNLGITFGTTNNRVLYTGFRKGNNMLATILNAIKKINRNNGKKNNQAIIIIETGAKNPKKISKAKKIEYLLNNGDLIKKTNQNNGKKKNQAIVLKAAGAEKPINVSKAKEIEYYLLNNGDIVEKINQNSGTEKNQSIILKGTGSGKPRNLLKAKEIEYYLNNGDIIEEENTANEILDASESGEDSDDAFVFRRKQKPSKFRDRGGKYKTSSESGSSTALDQSSEYEKNPGNPFTIFKSKYMQNWLWNHFMDGSHMNLNPYGPQLHNLGPSGPQLFFNRKWWYFNQDDYKPMG